ncbi:MAG: 50S ribosomal protein L9 [Candidatus Aminicenantes bacterium]|nr:50S ribosomal protein L9 [Candidatus Aminicenantes bacterium]
MKVIQKDNIENLGRKGDIVEIAPGYGRNYLIPKKLALEVSLSNMKMIEMEQQALKKRLEKEVLSYQELIQQLNQTTLSFVRKAGEKDIIFGSVSSSDVKEALDKVGFEIDKKKILLIEPIKRLGNFTVAIKVFHEQQAEVKIEVIKEEEEGKEKKKVEEENVLEEKKEVIESEEKEEKEK